MPRKNERLYESTKELQTFVLVFAMEITVAFQLANGFPQAVYSSQRLEVFPSSLETSQNGRKAKTHCTVLSDKSLVTRCGGENEFPSRGKIDIFKMEQKFRKKNFVETLLDLFHSDFATLTFLCCRACRVCNTKLYCNELTNMCIAALQQMELELINCVSQTLLYSITEVYSPQFEVRC